MRNPSQSAVFAAGATCIDGRRGLAAAARIALLVLTVLDDGVAAQQALTDEQVATAIALGKAGTAPFVRVGASRDFEVFIRGPVGRIAAVAADAVRQLRPFEPGNVTAEMRAPTFLVTVLSTRSGQYLRPSHIVLQPKDAKGVEGVTQPLSEGQTFDRTLLGLDATFNRLPENELNVVVVAPDGSQQRFAVTAQQRAQIR